MGKTAALTVYSVPKLGVGKPLVRFLGPVRGFITHFVKGRPAACPGPDQCKNHDIKQTWKGYAPGQVWYQSEKLWFPHVVEVSAGLLESIGSEDLRGQCWTLYRVQRTYGKRAVEADFVRHYDSHDLPKAFDVQRTVENLYGTRNILWDIPGENFAREVAACSDDAPELPREPERNSKEMPIGENAAFKRHLRDFGKEMNGEVKK